MAPRPNRTLGSGAATQDAGTPTTRGRGGPKFTLKPTKQSCIVLGALTVLTLGGCVGLYFWQSSSLNDIKKQVSDTRDEVASGQKIAGRLQEVQADEATTAGKLSYLEKSVTENQYERTLLPQIEALATSTNLQLNGIRPVLVPAAKAVVKKADGTEPTPDDAKKAPPPPTYDQLQMDMDISGTYWDVATMLAKLPEFPKIIQVDSVQVTPASTQSAANASPNLNVHLHLTGFIFPNDGEATPVPGGLPGATTTPVVPGAVAPGTPAAPGAPAPAAPQQRAMNTSSHGTARPVGA